MNTYKLSNISIASFQQFLFDIGCTRVSSGNDGHYKWKKAGCQRSVVFQTHIDPIPEMVIKRNLQTLGLSRKDFENWLKQQHKK